MISRMKRKFSWISNVTLCVDRHTFSIFRASDLHKWSVNARLVQSPTRKEAYAWSNSRASCNVCFIRLMVFKLLFVSTSFSGHRKLCTIVFFLNPQFFIHCGNFNFFFSRFIFFWHVSNELWGTQNKLNVFNWIGLKNSAFLAIDSRAWRTVRKFSIFFWTRGRSHDALCTAAL